MLEEVDLIAVASAEALGADSKRLAPTAVREVVGAGVDCAIVAGPLCLGQDAAEMFIDAGVHCLLTQPCALALESLPDVSRWFEDAGLIGAVGNLDRYTPAVQELRRRLALGQLGALYQISTRREGGASARDQDALTLQDVTAQNLDLTTWLAASPYRTISAVSTGPVGRRGAEMISVTGSLSDDKVVNHVVNDLSPLFEHVISVTGERGHLIADLGRSTLTFHASVTHPADAWETATLFRRVGEGDEIRYVLRQTEPLRLQHQVFWEAVRGQGCDVVTFREGAHTLSVMKAVMMSTRTGNAVQVGPVSGVGRVAEPA
ncbi:gfo/Idh/MocA family oxidoreductase [Serinicoccus chungangensis]|uniref:gfo/Idh/MocA family oxidoreductase n=1 Tax=Serinicoccus chungangensis TaxID=767452 RepID=UPI00130516A1|nr:gfo/Idh/MocA family oxidoreductase [Serinicoccus chungangensis]